MYRIILFFLYSVVQYAQQPDAIIGVLLDANNQAVQGVSVSLEGTSLQQFSDTLGHFELTLPPNTTSGTLVLTHPDFQSQSVPFSMVSGTLDLGIWQMRYTAENHYEGFLDSALLVQDQDQSEERFGPLLTAQRDPFLNAAAFSFSAAFFRFRGLGAEHQEVLINGLSTLDFETGRPAWSRWGGLNDFTNASRQTFYGIQSQSTAFGTALGTTEIRLWPSELREGSKLSVAFSNTSYQNRLMASHVGHQSDWFNYALLVSRRIGSEGYREGTSYESLSFAGMVEFFWNPFSRTNLVLLYSPTLRGQSAPLTEEVFNLKGKKYNPYWGFNRGQKRNARQVRTEIPQVYLSHRWEANSSSLWALNLRFQKGRSGRSRLSYNGVAPQEGYFIGGGYNPSPVYYQMLPSYFLRNDDRPDFEGAYWARKQLLEDGQLDWDALYEGNRQNDWAVNALYEDRIAQDELAMSLVHQAQWSNDLAFQLRIASTTATNNYFATPTALFGADFIWNVDAYASNFESGFYDLENTQTPIQKGAPFQYHYSMGVMQNSGSLQWVYDRKFWTFFAAGKLQQTTYQRTGHFKNGAYPETSLGTGTKISFTTLNFKSGLQYRISGRHNLRVDGAYIGLPPAIRNAYIQPRLREKIIPQLRAETNSSLQISYQLTSPKVHIDLRGYGIRIDRATQSRYYFADGIGGDQALFVQEVLGGISKLHLGLELGASYQLSDQIEIQGAANYGSYSYTNTPQLWLASAPTNNTVLVQNKQGLLDMGVTYIEGYQVPSGPQQAYHLGFNYSNPNYWRLGLSGNFFLGSMINFNPLTRTQNFYRDFDGQPFVDYDPKAAQTLLVQERLPNSFLLNLNFNKSWKIGQHYFGLFMSVQNILDRVYKTGGFEQSRNANFRSLREDQNRLHPIFAPKYWWGNGTTYFTSMYYRF